MKSCILFIALILLSPASLSTQAQHGKGDHKHASPHGGNVKTAGNYHLELVQKERTLTVYLLDANQKTLPVINASATALLQTPDGKVTTAKLLPTGKEMLVATLDKTKPFHKAVINVTVKGQSASASFDLKSAKATGNHTTPNP